MKEKKKKIKMKKIWKANNVVNESEEKWERTWKRKCSREELEFNKERRKWKI